MWGLQNLPSQKPQTSSAPTPQPTDQRWSEEHVLTLNKFLVYLEFFSAPGSKPFSSFAVSYPLQFPLILGRSNLFLNLWQVQFVNNFSKAAKVIGTKTSHADQQFQGFSDPLKCPVDIGGVLFLILSFRQLFRTCKYIIVKRITKHQTAVTKPEPRIKRNVTGQFPRSNCVLLFTLLLISLFGKLGSDNHKAFICFANRL